MCFSKFECPIAYCKTRYFRDSFIFDKILQVRIFVKIISTGSENISFNDKNNSRACSPDTMGEI